MAKDPAPKERFAGLLMDLPSGWRDITDDLDQPSLPTLALEDGVGVIQFSAAVYAGGKRPTATEADLQEMFSEFCKKQRLKIKSLSWTAPSSMGVGGTSVSDTEFVGAWYVSDGSSFALVTYTSLDPRDPRTLSEVRDADSIVRSIEFDGVRSR